MRLAGEVHKGCHAGDLEAGEATQRHGARRRASLKSEAARQELGNTIINFCNEHAQRSLADYGLQEIGYARLILHGDGKVTYFE